MPTLDESFPAIESALTAHYGRATPAPPLDDRFVRLVAVVLGLANKPAQMSRARRRIEDSGLLSPEYLAEAEIDEVAHVLAFEAPVSVPLVARLKQARSASREPRRFSARTG